MKSHVDPQKLLERIALHFDSVEVADMDVLEKQVARLLEKAGFGRWSAMYRTDARSEAFFCNLPSKE